MHMSRFVYTLASSDMATMVEWCKLLVFYKHIWFVPVSADIDIYVIYAGASDIARIYEVKSMLPTQVC